MSDTIILTGYDLTYDQIKEVAVFNKKVLISDEGWERLQKAREAIIRASMEQSIYGLNTGVGWNKDKTVSEEFHVEYNKNLLRSHMIGIDPECDITEIRAILLVRLNSLLCGHTGASPEIAEYYVAFLNRGIHPVIKKRASVSVADIGTLSAVGLAMIGEGDVFYKGERVPAYAALRAESLPRAQLGAKDGLSIISSNAQSAAFGSMVVLELEHFLSLYHKVYCLSLEGFNGVVEPLGEEINKIRGYQGQIECSRICRKLLEGSYLYDEDPTRALQDPLSFRCHNSIAGAVMDALEYLKKQLAVELNTSDDNPCIMPDQSICSGSSNFIPLSWVFALEMLAIALNHLSKMISNRMARMVDPNFTDLPRFLSPDEDKVIAFSTIQKTFASLDGENRMYANPSSIDFLNLAGQIEDHGSNAATEADKVRRIIDNLFYMLGVELMHGAQAIDLRQPPKLGKGTKEIYEAFRQVVPFLDKDRMLSPDIETAYDFLKSYCPERGYTSVYQKAANR